MTPRVATLFCALAFTLGAPRGICASATIGSGGSRLAVSVRSLQELRFARLVQQSWDVSCGAAALSTLLTYHLDRPVSEYAVATSILRGTDPRRVRERGGFSLLDLKHFSRSLGFSAEGFGGMTADDLAGSTPAIVPVRIHGLDHFVVVRAVVAGRVLVGDPAFGNFTISIERFSRLWKGGIAFVVRDPGSPAIRLAALEPEITALRVPDLPAVARLLRGAGPAPLTRTHSVTP
jgi:predicted double-glycine peptidase